MVSAFIIAFTSKTTSSSGSQMVTISFEKLSGSSESPPCLLLWRQEEERDEQVGLGDGVGVGLSPIQQSPPLFLGRFSAVCRS